MKIISGYLKGRKIDGFDIMGTRPTMDRVKESLFAMIQDKIDSSDCLDLYAGSGNLGIEAISNGSKLCYFVDCNKRPIQILKQNIKNLQIENKSKVFLTNDITALKLFEKEKLSFDIIFLDPPYNQDNLKVVMKILDDKNILKENGIVICEFTRRELISDYKTLKLYKSRQYGEKWIYIYSKNIDEKEKKKV